MIKILIIAFIFLILLSTGFVLSQSRHKVTPEQQYAFILEQYEKEIKNDPTNVKIRENFYVTLDYWLNKLELRSLKELKYYNHKLADIILFNESKDRALLFLIGVEKEFDKTHEPTWVIAAKKLDNDWRFYFGVVTFTYGYLAERQTQYTFEELSRRTIENIAWDGYLLDNSLIINDDYITHKWFTKDADELYQKFIEN